MIAKYENLLKNIPDYKEFLTLEEMDANSRKLAEAYPDNVEIFEIGRTREDRPLLCLKIGKGSHVGLMFGCPHPNEPIGTMMLEYFTEQLAKDSELCKELDYTWYIVKVWDADGYSLNDKWIKGPYSITNYSRNFFRPAGFKQVDWTFPIDYKQLHFHDSIPETVAMMKLIDQIRPDFIYALHNAGFGGTYWYLSKDLPDIYENLYEATRSQEIPMHLGEAETPYCVEYAPAVYACMGIKQDYDYMEQYAPESLDEALNVGTCSADYAEERYGSFTLLTELPYFYDKRINNLSTSDRIRRDVVIEKCDWSLDSNRKIREALSISENCMSPENPFLLAINAFTSDGMVEAEKALAMKAPEYEEKATEAEVFDNLLVSRFYRVLSYGMMVRAHEYEYDRLSDEEKAGEKGRTLLKGKEACQELHSELAAYLEENMDYEVVPIRKLVSIQLECGLILAEKLKTAKC